MKRFTKKWTLALAASALLMAPVAAAAQTPPPEPPTTQPPATAQQEPATPAATAKIDAAREHLAKAKAALDDITTASLSAGARTQVAELKRRINTLERSVAANDSASATGTEKRSPQATAGARGAAEWGTEVAAIDKALTSLLGPEDATGTPVGTAGTPPAKGEAAAVELDATSRAKLTEVRTHVTAFATAMAGGTPSLAASCRTERVVSKMPVARCFARSKEKPSSSSATWIRPPEFTQ